jgi:outer membrane immunogenic protein
MKNNSFKKIILVTTLALTTNLQAQEDLDWSGPFIGLDVGYTWTTDKKDNNSRDGNHYYSKNQDNGGLVGINTGYNFMLNEQWLLGITGEYRAYDAQDSFDNLQNGVPNNVTTVSSVDQKVSLLAKLGYLINNKTLLFVAGGYATTEMTRKYDQRLPDRSEKHKDWQNGWTLGFGGDYNFYQNFSANLEYRYTDLGKDNVIVAMWNDAPQPQKVSQNEVTFGITYHF